MIFTDIPAGSDVFVDANIFVYYFTPHPTFGPACSDLLDRIENKLLVGLSSASILSDVAHRLMALEANMTWGWPFNGMAQRLKRHPAEIQQLSRCRQAIDEITAIGIRILDVSGSSVSRAADVSRQYGLLMNDALIITMMREQGIVHLASHDADFDRVPSITRYMPV